MFNDEQSEIAERKTGDQQGPGERGKNAIFMHQASRDVSEQI
jgi:hypothetical protein